LRVSQEAALLGEIHTGVSHLPIPFYPGLPQLYSGGERW
jgi:hypothetical protein